MRNKIAVCILTLTTGGYATAALAAAEFAHDGKPVDPLCLYNAELAEGATVSLSDCIGDVVLPDNDARYVKDDGTVGVKFGFGGAVNGFAEYRVLGKINNQIGLFLTTNGGGSGVFTTVMTVTQSADDLTVDHIYATGDRCTGGVRSASITDGQLTYATNMTPADFVTLPFGDNANQNEAGGADVLPDCAACCVASATYRGDTLETITFDQDASGTSDADDPAGSPAACFDKLTSSRNDSAALSADDLQAFGRQIGQTCLGWKAGAPK